MTTPVDCNTAEQARVVIIGGGATGRAAGDALMRFGVKPDEILIIEDPENVGNSPHDSAQERGSSWSSIRRRFTGVSGVRQDEHGHGLVVDIAGGVIRTRNVVATVPGPADRLPFVQAQTDAPRPTLRRRGATDVPGLFVLTAKTSRFSSLGRDARAIARRVEGRP